MCESKILVCGAVENIRNFKELLEGLPCSDWYEKLHIFNMKKVSNFVMVTVIEVGYQHSFLWKHNEQFRWKVFPDLTLSAKFSLNH